MTRGMEGEATSTKSKLLIELPMYCLIGRFPQLNPPARKCPEIVALLAMEKDVIWKPHRSYRSHLNDAAIVASGGHGTGRALFNCRWAFATLSWLDFMLTIKANTSVWQCHRNGNSSNVA